MKIKKMMGEIFSLPANIDLKTLEGVEVVNETSDMLYYRFRKSGNFVYSSDDIKLEFEIFPKKKQVSVEFPEEVQLSQGALVRLVFPGKVSRCKAKCNGDVVFDMGNLLVKDITFRIPSTYLSEENILNVSYDGLPWEEHIKKTAFKTKDPSKILVHTGEKVVINRENLLKSDIVMVGMKYWEEDEVYKPGSEVKVLRQDKVIAYMVV